jgi:hypothetical protein
MIGKAQPIVASRVPDAGICDKDRTWTGADGHHGLSPFDSTISLANWRRESGRRTVRNHILGGRDDERRFACKNISERSRRWPGGTTTRTACGAANIGFGR